jgi:hypothetical protein
MRVGLYAEIWGEFLSEEMKRDLLSPSGGR